MAARSKAAKRRSRPGPKPRQDVIRTPSGRISESKESQHLMTRLEREAATWKRRQIDPTLSADEALKQEHGSVIAKWLHDYQTMRKRYPDGNHPNEFTRLHFDTAERYQKLYANWLGVIDAKRCRSASDFDGAGGYDGRDPFEADVARRHAVIEADFKEARRAILESGPLGMMAVEAIVIENQPVERLRGDLRMALNRLSVLWRLQAAA